MSQLNQSCSWQDTEDELIRILAEEIISEIDRNILQQMLIQLAKDQSKEQYGHEMDV